MSPARIEGWKQKSISKDPPSFDVSIGVASANDKKDSVLKKDKKRKTSYDKKIFGE
jgi:hypothetical protein